jgi:hypothetical protein
MDCKILHSLVSFNRFTCNKYCGLFPYYLFFSAPRYSLNSNFSGFGVARNNTNVSPNSLVMDVRVDPPELWFQCSFDCDVNGTYNFIFVFSFKIISKITATENMFFNASSHGSAVWLQYQVNDVSSGWMPKNVGGEFSIENTFGSSIRKITPGNCSGSYMTLSSLETAFSRSTVPPRITEATMFRILVDGILEIGIPWFLNSSATFFRARFESFSDLAPVQTILPVLKMRVVVFGFFSLKTSPGKRSGLYSI